MAAKVSFEGERELRWIVLGECVVAYLEAEVDFSDAAWDAWVDAFAQPDITRLMLCSWGPTQPSHQQWRRATRLMRDRRMPVAVVTEARHNLALAKAASWLGTNIESYRWHQLGDACEFLELAKADKIANKAKIIALRDRFGPVIHGADMGSAGYSSSAGRSRSDGSMEVSSELVLETSSEIQAKLAEIQARLRERERSADYVPHRDS
jgi:hypothetical protein